MSKSVIGIKELVQLFRLGRKRLDSPQDYQALEEYQGQLLVGYLEGHGLSLNDKKVLDLGSGFGGYTISLQSRGAYVTGLDLANPKDKPESDLVCANALSTPFASGVFDLVISISLIEHVKEPEELVKEMVRTTKPGGYIYLSFPPFYSPVGGHHFSPWHLFGEKVAVWAFSKRKWHVNQNWTDEQYDFKTNSFERAFGNYGILKLKIRQVRAIIYREKLRVLDQSVKYLRFNASLLPLIGDFLSWHVQFLSRKAD